MEVQLEPGKYILAVSGGVDSMVLLDILRQRPDIQLIVAHYDHGIRTDSAQDRDFVQQIAVRYGLPCVSEEGKLGANASEATARLARYAFFECVRQEHGASGLILAHHQDDVLETAILNLIRGTGRKGLTALASTPRLIRPLINTPKAAILRYAQARQLVWREDSTNADDRYLRNYIRHHIMPRFDTTARNTFLTLIDHMRQLNSEIDELIDILLQFQAMPNALGRQWFVSLSHAVSMEVFASWLRRNRLAMFDAKTVERLVVNAKVKPPGAMLDVMHGYSLAVRGRQLVLVRPIRTKF